MCIYWYQAGLHIEPEGPQELAMLRYLETHVRLGRPEEEQGVGNATELAKQQREHFRPPLENTALDADLNRRKVLDDLVQAEVDEGLYDIGPPQGLLKQSEPDDSCFF